MKKLWIALALVAVLSGGAWAEGPAVDPGIEQACLDYVEGWYTGDAERMDRALHPDLAKRRARVNEETGASDLVDLTKDQMVEYTNKGGGTKVPENERQIQVTVLDVYQNAAAARVDSGRFVDFIHLAKWDGKWMILNVLWENRPSD